MAKKSDPGLGSIYSGEIKRLINPDGSYNMKRHGSLRGVKDLYKYLIEVSWWLFILFALLSYLFVNCFFALLYMLVGTDGISGLNPDLPDFLNAFFFSVQTFTSVGYGTMSPISLGTNIIETFESFFGLMSIALITGLLYGRFSRPKSKLAFSKNILTTPYEEGMAVMFKMVNKRNSILLNAHVKTILIMDKGGDENRFNKTYAPLELEVDQVNFFPLTWTLVHAIREDSPFRGLTMKDLQQRNAEVLVLVEAFDETHSQSITEKKGYGGDQWLEGYKFDRNFGIGNDGELELFIDELDNLIPLR